MEARASRKFLEAQKRLTLAGNIVISVGLFGHSGDDEVWTEGTKEMLDDMHKRKIDMADEIFVINVGGYIGASTRSEIEYAERMGKKVAYLEEPGASVESPIAGFSPFDPSIGKGKDLPGVPGNYLVTIRDISALPTLGYTVETKLFNGQNLIYTGIAGTSIRERIWRNHLGGNAGHSTLRLTLGCLFGYTFIPRDKKDPDNGHVRFNEDDERELTAWMKKNLIFHYLPCDTPKVVEGELIGQFNPPLNLSGNINPVNQEFRSALTLLRSQTLGENKHRYYGKVPLQHRSSHVCIHPKGAKEEEWGSVDLRTQRDQAVSGSGEGLHDL